MNPNDAYLLRNLATFEVAARVGGFSRAANELRLSRVAVSRQMAELEASWPEALPPEPPQCKLDDGRPRSVGSGGAGAR
jgi:hypothetical protein